ncbi:LOW QUALITY PROTEIN: betaine--homocysteine S-methyltransferase 1-like [Haliotis rubra]|uniref:LOW QUALITY PROTEIN: betaine--homocysteine S-methyltransferase 1-like n=1 Tax=Haliotis rubra TaxID=36100 RepID=UPI001EE54A10|nr:LOW QUALITY PROTEIN: betaine--homocysteine S-methyltransferase 1-like [Haliotis rubra]
MQSRKSFVDETLALLCFKGLLQRLQDKEDIVVAEGYVFEFERRGLLKAGAFVPEVVIERPDLVKVLHEEFVNAGSDVCLAFTYYGHREKLRVIGREGDLERLNRDALRIAKQVADDTGTLMAGNLCNTTVYRKDNKDAIETTEAMFKEQIEWAVEEGADYIVGETFSELGEAMLALECINKYGNGLPAAISFNAHTVDKTSDGLALGVACRRLEDAGAAAVGLNCGRGPRTMLPLIREIRQACKGPVIALPVTYRTCSDHPTFQSLKDPLTGARAFPVDLPGQACGRSEIADFAREAKSLGVQYVGLCCGNASHYIRVVAEEYGRRPPASRYSPDMSQHFIFGKNKSSEDPYQQALKKKIAGITG